MFIFLSFIEWSIIQIVNGIFAHLFSLPNSICGNSICKITKKLLLHQNTPFTTTTTTTHFYLIKTHSGKYAILVLILLNFSVR